MAGTRSRRCFWRCECWQAALAIVLLLLTLQATGCAGFPVSASSANPSAEPFAIATSTLPSGAMGSAYSASLSASGGRAPYTWTLSAGQLPPGLSISTNAGEISGNPTESSEWTFILQAADSSSPAQIATKSLTILVSKAASSLQITTTSLAVGQVGSRYMANVTASGGTAPYSWSITEGELPIGLTLDGARGELLGTPTQSGAFSTTLQVTDSSSPKQTATATLTLVISPSSSERLRITTTFLPDAQQNAMYSATLTASGGTSPYTWSITEGALPTGLVLNNATGEISGRPAKEGSFPIKIGVKDSSSPTQEASASLDQTVNGPDSQDCPTGQPCGATAPYCESYAPPSTVGATRISSLPYNVSTAGDYYLDSDLTSVGNGIYITYIGRSRVDINLNGHTITYGTVEDGSGATATGEYGILLCDPGNLISEGLDSKYGSNGECAGGVREQDVTVENGSIVQSLNASQYYDPSNCPGSGVGAGSIGSCANQHPTVASHVINMQYVSGITIRHLTLTWQNVDSDGILLGWQNGGGTDTVECNALNDKVTLINSRSYANGEPILIGGSRADHADLVQYNSIVGAPHLGINMQSPGGIIQYNDIDMAHYQAPPYTSALQSYSNDYGIGPFSCPVGGLIAYNYIHGANGRGIGCILPGRGYADLHGLQIVGNYVDLAEQQTNAEYGPNGDVNGGVWVGGCEGGGGRGFETKGATSFVLKDNTLIYNVLAGGCGGAAIQTIALPCFGVAGCAATTASQPITYQSNIMEVVNGTGNATLPTGYASCYDFELTQGDSLLNREPIFTSPLGYGNTCITDGDYISTAPDSGNVQNFTFSDDVFALGSHPFSNGCGEPLNGCGQAINWNCGDSGPSDCTGFVLQDITLRNGAGFSFNKWINSTEASSATVRWTYTVTVQTSTGAIVPSATVSAIDAGGEQSSCITNSNGQCKLELRQESVTFLPGDSTLKATSDNPIAIAITAGGCAASRYALSILDRTAETRVLSCP